MSPPLLRSIGGSTPRRTSAPVDTGPCPESLVRELEAAMEASANGHRLRLDLGCEARRTGVGHRIIDAMAATLEATLACDPQPMGTHVVVQFAG